MPELPEVETMRRGLLGIRGGSIRALDVHRCRLRPIEIRPPVFRLRRKIVGRRVLDIDRVGKRVVWRLSDQSCLVFEPRMTGLLLTGRPFEREHLRLSFRIDRASVQHVHYWDRRGLGKVYWLSEEEARARLGDTHLGPDALDVGPGPLWERLQRSRRELKVQLLDQRVLAGIGNLYASEILFVAGIDPRKRGHELDRKTCQRLCRAIGQVLRAAIAFEGSTLKDGTYRNSLSQSGSYQNHHRVYDRAGEPCPRCRTPSIQRIVQAQRSTFFCPGCQK